MNHQGNAIKTVVLDHLTTVTMAVIKKTANTSVRKDVEGEPSCTVGGNVGWCSHSGKPYQGFSKN